MKTLIACGGTGGHINPGLAIAGIIAEHDPEAEFLFVGTPDGMEAQLIPAAGYEMDFVRAAGFQRSLTLENLRRNAKAVRYLATSGGHARSIVRRFAPDLAIGTGGYASGPVIWAAQQLGVPTAVHEQNAYPGVTNKLLARRAKLVMLTFPAAQPLFPSGTNCVVTGLPVRRGMARCTREEAREKLGFPKESMLLLSFGGSQGAACLNGLMPDLMKWHLDSEMDICQIHAYGKFGKETVPSELETRGISGDRRLRVSEYIHDMDICLAAADLVICRAGASTLTELEAVGRASVLIPYPSAAENHQYHNAMVLGNADAAVVIEQKDLTLEKLKETVEALYRDKARREAMGSHAAALFQTDTDERIWAELEKITRK